MAITWEQAQTEFPQAEADAVLFRTCFCVCGCRAADVPNWAVLGTPVPGLCATCKKGLPHARIASPAMLTSYEAEAEAEPVPARPRTPRPVVSDEQQRKAAEYIERKADEPTRLVADLIPKVESGKPLTERQVEAVLAAEAAESRDHGRAYKRLLDDHQYRGRREDLTRLHIPQTVKDGSYAVKASTGDLVRVDIARPAEGGLRGYVVATFTIGETVHYGVQRPDLPGFLGRAMPAVYKGWFPQLIADLIANPDDARQMYEVAA